MPFQMVTNCAHNLGYKWETLEWCN
jgi:hypothetical protein